MFESSLYNKLYNINQERAQKITADNIRAGVNIFGTVGTYTLDSNAQSLDIANGKTAYVNGIKTFGSLKEYNEVNSMPIHNISMDTVNSNLNAQFINRRYINGEWKVFPQGIIRNGANITIPYNTITNALRISPTDIKKDVKVFDITGTYDASTEFEGIKMDPVVASSNAVSLTRSISEISGLDTANGTNMAGFFSELRGLVSVSNLDLTNVTTVASLFSNDYKLSTLKSINMYNSEISNISASYMFANCNSLVDIDETIIMPKIINSTYCTFANCTNLVNINTVMNIRSPLCANMFFNCSQLQDISNIKFISPGTPTQTSYMFQYCRKLNFETVNLQGLGLNNPYSMFMYSNVSNALVMENIFNSLTSLNLASFLFAYSNIDKVPNIQNFAHVLSNWHTFDYSFRECPKLMEGDINISNFNNITFRSTFWDCKNLISSNLILKNNYKPSNHFYAYNLQDTYYNCSNLKSVNISCDNATFCFINTFINCYNLETVTMPTNWSIANMTFTNTFRNCYSIDNLYDTIRYVTNINNLSIAYAFFGCRNLHYDEEIILNANSPGIFLDTFTGCYNITNNLTLNIYQPANAAIMNTSGLASGAGFNNIHITFNYPNMINAYYGTYLTNFIINCPNVKTADIDLYFNSIQQNTNRKTYLYGMVDNCYNITDINYNCAMYNDYLSSPPEYSLFLNCPNLTNLKINMILGKVNNTTISTAYQNNSCISYMVSNCNNLRTFDLNLDIGVNIDNMFIAKDCPNLTDINYNITFNTGCICMYKNTNLFKNCPNLSDTLIDNILGTLHNIPNYRGTKRLSLVFSNCNISNVRYESLSNYANIVADGWTIN